MLVFQSAAWYRNMRISRIQRDKYRNVNSHTFAQAMGRCDEVSSLTPISQGPVVITFTCVWVDVY